MKRFTLAGIIALAFTITHTVTAQVQVGLRGGATWSGVTKPSYLNSLPTDIKFDPGITGAVFLEVPLSNRVSFRPEVQYMQKGFAIRQSFDIGLGGGFNIPLGAKIAYQTRFIETPMLFKINLNDGPVQGYLLAGGSAGYGVSGRIRTRGSGIFQTRPMDFPIEMGNGAFNRWDFSAIGGLGLSAEIGAGKFFAEARYQHGFSRQYELSILQLPIRNQGISASIGYSFPIGQ